MQKLFLDYTPENEIILDGEEARHIAKSLRMKVGDMLTVTDGNGNDFGCQIETYKGYRYTQGLLPSGKQQ